MGLLLGRGEKNSGLIPIVAFAFLGPPRPSFFRNAIKECK